MKGGGRGVRWFPVIGYDSYFISKIGVWSVRCGRIMKFSISMRGYLIISISKNGKTKNISFHRLLAIHFIPNPDKKRTVNHKNGIKTDNRISNLEWNTYKENVNHSLTSGLRKTKISRIDALTIKKSKLPIRKLAEQFGIVHSYVCYIKNNRSWKYLPQQ